MSRSLGDFMSHTVGVSAEPEVQEFELTPDDQIIIVASDGIWEFMSVQNVASIAQAHFEQGAAEAAANAIVRRAA
jgi:serine/threonine protein phosphatase PrpC